MRENRLSGLRWRVLETDSQEHRASARPYVRPAKLDVFSGSKTHPGKSRNPVAKMAGTEVTKYSKPI